jgi:hypothetical protein
VLLPSSTLPQVMKRSSVARRDAIARAAVRGARSATSIRSSLPASSFPSTRRVVVDDAARALGHAGRRISAMMSATAAAVDSTAPVSG